MVLDQLSSKIPNKASSFFTEFNSRSITRLSGAGRVRSGIGSGAVAPFEAHALRDSKISSKAVVFREGIVKLPGGLGGEEVDLVLQLQVLLVGGGQLEVVLDQTGVLFLLPGQVVLGLVVLVPQRAGRQAEQEAQQPAE